MNNSQIAIFRKAGIPIEITETRIPELGPGQILVKNLYVTLCRSDINTFIGKRIEKTPTILGHEIVGIIEDFGPYSWPNDERGYPVYSGDRITWAIYSSDPESPMAKKGFPQKAANLFKYGHEEITKENTLHGGLAEYTVLRKNTPVVKLSDNISNSFAATINCTVATVAGVLRLAGEIDGKSVGIIGTGMLGSIACAMCKTKGASKIIAFDIDNTKLQNAKLFGADECFNLIEESDNIELLPKSDIVLEFSGSPDSVERSLLLLNLGGVTVWAGATFHQRDIKINAEKIIRNLHTIKGLHNYTNHDLIAAVTFVESHYEQFPFEDMIEAEFSLGKVNEAFDYAVKNNPYRVGINLVKPDAK